MIGINNLATAGLDTVDIHLTDGWIDPPDARHPRPATGTLYRLASGYSCFEMLEMPLIARDDGP